MLNKPRKCIINIDCIICILHELKINFFFFYNLVVDCEVIRKLREIIFIRRSWEVTFKSSVCFKLTNLFVKRNLNSPLVMTLDL